MKISVGLNSDNGNEEMEIKVSLMGDGIVKYRKNRPLAGTEGEEISRINKEFFDLIDDLKSDLNTVLSTYGYEKIGE
jgi:hypothetical protein